MSIDAPLTVVDLIRALQKLPLDTRLIHYTWDERDGVVLTEANQAGWQWLRVKRFEDGSAILFTQYDREMLDDGPLDFSA